MSCHSYEVPEIRDHLFQYSCPLAMVWRGLPLWDGCRGCSRVRSCPRSGRGHGFDSYTGPEAEARSLQHPTETAYALADQGDPGDVYVVVSHPGSYLHQGTASPKKPHKGCCSITARRQVVIVGVATLVPYHVSMSLQLIWKSSTSG